MLTHSDRADVLHHGGRLHLAAKRYDIPLAQWLDLSTGINPNGWPVPPIPAIAWNRLPEDDDGLDDAARDYYGAPHILPVAGSQAAIQALPQIIRPGRATFVRPGYAEHPQAWVRCGHSVTAVAATELDAAIDTSDTVVLVNPNNPNGAVFPRDRLLEWQERLSKRDGWLVVDEAFVDSTPQISLASYARHGLVILRSLGKFFGLAGARVGFVCAEPALLQRLGVLLGPWALTTPSRQIARLALADHAWQQTCQAQLKSSGARLAALLQRHDLSPQGGCGLFQWVPTTRAAHVHDRLAQRGILTRYFDDPQSLRIGLPRTEEDWTRLDTSLGAVVSAMKLCP
ncbi:MAG TPA: threonine-phosphate decarboxylase CobD [Burkholderiales bacterium]|nr:threonine-phosphate decarboxylase CobD [Burkholderiales bacterium]